MKSFRSPIDQRGATSSSCSGGAIYYPHNAAKWKSNYATSLEKSSPVNLCYGRQGRKEDRYGVQPNFLPTSPITISAAAYSNGVVAGRGGGGGTGHHNSASNNSLSSSCSSARSTPSNQTTSLSSSFTSQTDEQTSQHFASSNSRDFSIIDMDDELFASMRMEVDAAVDYLTYLLIKAHFNARSSESFRQSLTVLLMHHYAGHWYPDDPLRGSGYRCLRVNGVMHPLLANAAEVCAIPLTSFRRAFPAEFTIWIDPGNVNVRIGEDGSIGAFSKCDNETNSSSNGGGSLSPYFFTAGVSTSATVSPAHHTSFYGGGSGAPTPMIRRIVVSPTTTNSSNNQQNCRSYANRTRLFQQQTQAHNAKELSPLHKALETVLQSEQPTTKKDDNSSKSGNVSNTYSSNVRSSPVIGYRSEDHGLVEHSSKNSNNTLDDQSNMAAVRRELSRRVAANFELCPNIHIGSKSGRQQHVVPLPGVTVEA